MSGVGDEEFLDDLNGEGNAFTEGAVPSAGPRVETDVSVTDGNSGLGAIVELEAAGFSLITVGSHPLAP